MGPFFSVTKFQAATTPATVTTETRGTKVTPETTPFFSVYVEAPVPRGIDSENSVIATYLKRCLTKKNKNIVSKVQQLIDAGGDVNGTLKSVYGLGRNVTALCIAAEKLREIGLENNTDRQDGLNLLKLLIRRGGITHKIPSKIAQERINMAAKELSFEQTKPLFKAIELNNAFSGIFPNELKQIFLESAMKCDPFTGYQEPQVLDQQEEDRSFEITQTFNRWLSPPVGFYKV